MAVKFVCDRCGSPIPEPRERLELRVACGRAEAGRAAFHSCSRCRPAVLAALVPPDDAPDRRRKPRTPKD